MIISPSLSDRAPDKDSLLWWAQRQIHPIVRALADAWNRTEWKTFTGDLTGAFTNDATIGNATEVGFLYRIVGDSLDAYYQVTWGATSSFGTDGLFCIPLPPGYATDADRLVAATTLFGATCPVDGQVASLGTTIAPVQHFVLKDVNAKLYMTTPFVPAPGDIVSWRVLACPVKKG